MGIISLRANNRHELPKAPPEISTAVELFARRSGRTAKLHFVPFGGWFVDLSLRSNDTRMTLWRDGKADKPPTERVWLHLPNPRRGMIVPGTHGEKEPRFRPLDIRRLGAAGVTEFLEKGNTFSGRGEYSSVEDAVLKVRDNNERERIAFREKQKIANRLEQREKRRFRWGIPFLPVGKDLEKKALV